jgi:hypothetical protein
LCDLLTHDDTNLIDRIKPVDSTKHTNSTEPFHTLSRQSLINMPHRFSVRLNQPAQHDLGDMPHLWCPCLTCGYIRYNNTVIGLWAAEQLQKQAAEMRLWKSLCGTLIAAGIFYFTWRRASAP